MTNVNDGSAIEINGVSKSFGALRAVNDVRFSVSKGEFFGLLGPNGAGKTTLINMMAGLCRLDAGDINVMGYDVGADYQLARRSLGVVPQELVFDPFFSVRETLVFQSGYFGIKGNDVWIDEILENLNLMDKANTNMRSLSGGMKRRVLVAQALVHRPPVIILDEPTAGVDVDLRRGLWAFIQKLNEEGHTIILTTHYLEEAEALCGRIGMLKSGKLVMIEDTANLLKRKKESNLRVSLKSPISNIPVIMDFFVETDPSEPQDLLIKIKSPLDIERVLGQLRKSGIEIDSLVVEKEDLEDVFLSVMSDKRN